MNILMMVQGLRQITTTLPNQLDLICLYKGKELEKLQKILTRLTANKIKMIQAMIRLFSIFLDCRLETKSMLLTLRIVVAMVMPH